MLTGSPRMGAGQGRADACAIHKPFFAAEQGRRAGEPSSCSCLHRCASCAGAYNSRACTVRRRRLRRGPAAPAAARQVRRSLPHRMHCRPAAVHYPRWHIFRMLQQKAVRLNLPHRSAADRENLLETLLYITQNVLDPANKALNLKVLQVWCGIIQCRDPRKVRPPNLRCSDRCRKMLRHLGCRAQSRARRAGRAVRGPAYRGLCVLCRCSSPRRRPMR